MLLSKIMNDLNWMCKIKRKKIEHNTTNVWLENLYWVYVSYQVLCIQELIKKLQNTSKLFKFTEILEEYI